MILHEEVYGIGSIGKPHGVRGEVGVVTQGEATDIVDAEPEYLVLEVDGILVPFWVESIRLRSDSVALVKFRGIDTPEALAEYRGCEVFFPRALRPEGEEDDYTWASLQGYLIKDAVAGDIGPITDIDEATDNILFHVGDILIPATEAFVTDIDHEARIIYMQLPEGLLDL